MKHLRLVPISITVLLLSVAGCSKQEAAPVADEETAPIEETTIVEEPVADVEAPAESEEIVVVEESSGADSEDSDEAIILAQADTTQAEARTWKYREGPNYTRMVPTQPTVGGPDKVEVAEVFMYSCPHCFDLESHMNNWADSKDPDVRFVRIPAMFNQLAALHAQLYYTEEVLARNGKLADQDAFRQMVFEEYHRRSNRLTSQAAIERLFTRSGVSAEDFQSTWESFEVNQKMRVAQDLTRRYSISSVPMIIVNGKYRTDTGMAGGYPKLIELIDELTAREGVR